MDATAQRRPNPDELAGLLAEFESLVRHARSVFPGRVLLPRKRAETLLEQLRNGLDPSAVATAEELGRFTPAFLAIDALEQAVIRGSTGASLWRLRFADLSRRRLSALTEDLRAALAAYTGRPADDAATG